MPILNRNQDNTNQHQYENGNAEWGKKTHEELSQALAESIEAGKTTQELDTFKKNLVIPVKRGDTLSTIMNALGRFDATQPVDYRSQMLTNKPKVAGKTDRIFADEQVLWIENINGVDTIIIDDIKNAPNQTPPPSASPTVKQTTPPPTPSTTPTPSAPSGPPPGSTIEAADRTALQTRLATISDRLNKATLTPLQKSKIQPLLAALDSRIKTVVRKTNAPIDADFEAIDTAIDQAEVKFPLYHQLERLRTQVSVSPLSETQKADFIKEIETQIALLSSQATPQDAQARVDALEAQIAATITQNLDQATQDALGNTPSKAPTIFTTGIMAADQALKTNSADTTAQDFIRESLDISQNLTDIQNNLGQIPDTVASVNRTALTEVYDAAAQAKPGQSLQSINDRIQQIEDGLTNSLLLGKIVKLIEAQNPDIKTAIQTRFGAEQDSLSRSLLVETHLDRAELEKKIQAFQVSIDAFIGITNQAASLQSSIKSQETIYATEIGILKPLSTFINNQIQTAQQATPLNKTALTGLSTNLPPVLNQFDKYRIEAQKLLTSGAKDAKGVLLTPAQQADVRQAISTFSALPLTQTDFDKLANGTALPAGLVDLGQTLVSTAQGQPTVQARAKIAQTQKFRTDTLQALQDGKAELQLNFGSDISKPIPYFTVTTGANPKIVSNMENSAIITAVLTGLNALPGRDPKDIVLDMNRQITQQRMGDYVGPITKAVRALGPKQRPEPSDGQKDYFVPPIGADNDFSTQIKINRQANIWPPDAGLNIYVENVLSPSVLKTYNTMTSEEKIYFTQLLNEAYDKIA